MHTSNVFFKHVYKNYLQEHLQEIGSFSKSPRVKKLSFTIFESIQPISGSGGSTFSLA